MTGYLTPTEAAKLLKCSAKTIIRLCANKRLPGAINLGVGKHDEWRIKPNAGGGIDLAPRAPRSAHKPKRRRVRADLPPLRIG